MGQCFKEKMYSDYKNMEDERLVELVHQGDGDALDFLIHKYQNFVRAKARSYFLVGADREDIVQEGMIGLYKAVRDFKGTSSPLLKRLQNFASQGR